MIKCATPWTRGYLSKTSAGTHDSSGEDEVDDLPPTQLITALGHEILDFADTAAIISLLDPVICVDTVVAHIAGAPRKACWVLPPQIGTDWRWLLK